MGLFGLVGPERYLALIDAILERNSRSALDLVDELASAGYDLVEFARGVVGYFRDLLLLRLDEELGSRVEKPEAVKQRMVAQATRFHPQDLLHLTQLAAENYGRMERAPHPRWLLEAQVVDYTRLESRVLLSELLGRLEPGGGAASGGDRRGVGSEPAATPSPPRGRKAEAVPSGPARRAHRTEGGMVGDAPDPSARPAARLGTASSEISDLADCFRRFAGAVRERNMGVGTCLVEAAPVLRGERLQLKFAPEHEFQRRQLSDGKTLRWLSGLTSECFGRCLEVEVVDARPEALEESLRVEVQRVVAPTAQQELDRLSRENPALGHLLDGLGVRIVEDDNSPSS
jgi:hypothetical protein